jgi:muramidase (phage lysozyme)
LAQEGTRITNFSATSKDKLAQWLRGNRAMDQVYAGNVEAAIAILNKRWASLPGDGEGIGNVHDE